MLDAAADLAKESDTYVFHEYLEDDNTPMFFFDFAARAGAHRGHAMLLPGHPTH